jgi:hypothetical protein
VLDIVIYKYITSEVKKRRFFSLRKPRLEAVNFVFLFGDFVYLF